MRRVKDEFNEKVAYKLTDSRSHKNYYDDWASTYDADFVKKRNYVYPKEIARLYRLKSARKNGSVLDIGCGTGLIGVELNNEGLAVDGIDISPKMLAHARNTNCYRELLEINLLETKTYHKKKYSALVSSGTFTVGHLEPETLLDTLTFGEAGALCIYGINSSHFKKKKFEKYFSSLYESNFIFGLEYVSVPIYGTKKQQSKSLDFGKVAIFNLGNKIC